jgi:gamma-glutamylcyclotransferase (GGCT)/AIG2-like uncharacterized protein YtfP
LIDLVFVYGTLRKGEANHRLLSVAEYCGWHTTRPCYRMLHLGTYPGVVEGGSTAIKGEVYRVNKKMVVQLDRLEACPRLYRKKMIPTPWGRAWIYIYRGIRDKRAVIPSGSWRGEVMARGPFTL